MLGISIATVYTMLTWIRPWIAFLLYVIGGVLLVVATIWSLIIRKIWLERRKNDFLREAAKNFAEILAERKKFSQPTRPA
jgi:hypothetical protein